MNKKLNLVEGYLGQTVDDFLDACTEPDLIDEFYMANIRDDDYNPTVVTDYDEVQSDFGECDFGDFDCLGEKVVINIDTTEEYSNNAFYSTVQDFIDDCNEEFISIFDLGTEEVVFDGERDEIPDDLLDAVFCSFDAPNKICINYYGEENDYDDDEDEEEDFEENCKK